MNDEPRCDRVLLVALAVTAGAPVALAPLPAAAATIGAALLLSRWVSRRLVVLALVLVAVAAGRAAWSLEEAAELHETAIGQLTPPPRCAVRAVVSRSPIVLRDQGRNRSPGDPLEARHQARVDVELLGGDCDGRRLDGGFRARLYGAPESLARGDVLLLVIDLAPVHLFDNPGLPDPRIRLALTGVAASGGVVDLQRLERGSSMSSWVDRARASVRRRIEATFAPDLAPFARALVLGESDLGRSERDAFRLSGLAHLLAVSGTHLVIAVVAFGRGLRALLARFRSLAARLDVGRISAGLCVPLVWLYADFAGGGGSAYRAAAMLTFAMVTRAAGRRPGGLRCFALSLIAGSMVEPLAICDLSFLLSVAATAGLVVGHRPIQGWAKGRHRVLRGFGTAMFSTVAAMSACAPVLLMIGSELPLLGVAANVLAAPVGELLALPLCLVHAVLWWSPAAEQGAALLAGGALAAVRAVAHAASEPAAAILELPPPTHWQLAVAAVGAVALWTVPRRIISSIAAVVTLAVLELVAIHHGAPHGQLRITVLDVGQGDALLVDLPDGKLMLVDGGGLVGSPVDIGERVVLRALSWRRRQQIDVAVLTHPHPDHYSGLQSTLRKLAVPEVWDTGFSAAQQPDGPVARWLAGLTARGVTVRSTATLCGGARRYGGAEVRVLSPCPTFDPAHGANDNSVVLLLRFGSRAALLVGDAEHAQEQALLAHHRATLGVDFLKVGHHGSRTSTGRAFVTAVSPTVAAISCGVRNRSGHPHRPTLATLAAAGAQVLRTDRGGAVVWETDGESQQWTQ
ncbi:MAG: DNA internalization-related competence protein ComEC/Rec2 [Deltaproteobacteria bacterium]|nr:MAG: DNA internalization-related competence protein ComEC/Rec2 [Deltaproteobacteria bacterium]